MLPTSTWRMPVRPSIGARIVGVAERRLRAFDRRLIGLHLRGVLRDQRALRVRLLAVDGVGGGELLVAREIDSWHWPAAPRPAPSWRPPDRVAALKVVGSIRARMSPFLTSWPSLKLTAISLPSTCGRTVTVLSALVVPTRVEIDRHVGARGGRGQHRHRAGRGEARGARRRCCCCGACMPKRRRRAPRRPRRARSGSSSPRRRRLARLRLQLRAWAVHRASAASRGLGIQPPPERLIEADDRLQWASRASTSVSCAGISVCCVCSTVTRSIVPSRSRCSEISKARRELVDHRPLQPFRCSAVWRMLVERVLDVGEAGNHRLAIVLQQFVLPALLQVEIAEQPAALEDRLRQSGRRRDRTPIPAAAAS